MEIKRATGKDGKTYRIYADTTIYGAIWSVEFLRLHTTETDYWDIVEDAPITTDREYVQQYFNKLIA